MKKKLLTKKLIIAAIIWLLLICGAVVAHFWLAGEIEYYETETIKNNTQYSANLIKQEDIAKNITQAEKAIWSYDNYVASVENDKDEYRKNALVRTLGDISRDLQTVKISFIMKSFENYAAIQAIDGIEVTFSPVTMKYQALTDVAALGILEEMRKRLSGKIYFKKFTAKKVKDIDSSVLLQISNGSMPYLVSGEIEFDWIQIRVEKTEAQKEAEKEAEKNAAQPAPAASPDNVIAPAAPAAPVAPAVSSTGGQDV